MLRLRLAGYVCVARMLEIGCVCCIDVVGSLRGTLWTGSARICLTNVFVSFCFLIV